MALLNKINISLIQNELICQKWDSRNWDYLNQIEYKTQEEITALLYKHNQYKKYSKCFLTAKYLNHITQFIDENKFYYKCELEISSIVDLYYFLKNNNFKNCIFYFNNYKDVSFVLNKSDKRILIELKSSNTIIEKSYIEHIAFKYNYNLGKVPKSQLIGLTINNTDLSKCILPKDVLFFKKLYINRLYDIKFDNVDFTLYDVSNISFNNIIFKNCILPIKKISTNGFLNCVLPPINFKNYTEDVSTVFVNCTFNKDTIFPENNKFFLKCLISECNLPAFDYSNYLVSNNTFKNCTFDNESILPKDIFNSKNIHIINNIQHIPIKYLSYCVQFAPIDNPNLFINKYKDYLSIHSLALLSAKYNLVDIQSFTSLNAI